MTVFDRFRPQAEVAAALGSEVSYLGTRYCCTGHNDLGALYWTPIGKKRDVYCEGIDIAAGFPRRDAA